jgi:hypothetical protein
MHPQYELFRKIQLSTYENYSWCESSLNMGIISSQNSQGNNTSPSPLLLLVLLLPLLWPLVRTDELDLEAMMPPLLLLLLILLSSLPLLSILLTMELLLDDLPMEEATTPDMDDDLRMEEVEDAVAYLRLE